MRHWLHWYCVIIVMAFAIIALGVRAHSEDDIQVGTGITCDTKEQVEQFASLNGTDEAIQQINSDAPKACAVLTIAYIRGKSVGKTQIDGKELDIVEILVVAVYDGFQFRRVEPAIQYTLFPATDGGV